MNFKKPKQMVIDEARMRAEDRIKGMLNSTFPNMTLDPYSIANTLTYAISAGIADAIQVVVENTYTDQEFEEDMTLRDK